MRGDVIDKLLQKCPFYIGTFASDELNKIMHSRLPMLAVFNNRPRKHKGEHWTVLYISRHGRGEFFDSFGFKPSSAIERFLNEHCAQWNYNDKRIQSFVSKSCGLFCVMYTWYKCKGKTLAELLSVFSSDTMLNDYIVRKFIKSL